MTAVTPLGCSESSSYSTIGCALPSATSFATWLFLGSSGRKRCLLATRKLLAFALVFLVISSRRRARAVSRLGGGCAAFRRGGEGVDTVSDSKIVVFLSRPLRRRPSVRWRSFLCFSIFSSSVYAEILALVLRFGREDGASSSSLVPASASASLEVEARVLLVALTAGCLWSRVDGEASFADESEAM